MHQTFIKAGVFYLFLQKWNPTEEKQDGRSEDWTENPVDIFVAEIMKNHGVKLHLGCEFPEVQIRIGTEGGLGTTVSNFTMTN